MKYKAFATLAFSVLAWLGIGNATAATVTLKKQFLGANDCAGYFGSDFNSCAIFATDETGAVQISPVIAKYDVELDSVAYDITISSETNPVFGSVTGDEFDFTLSSTGSWSYMRGYQDPGVRYWAVKGGNGFNLFWTVDSAVLGGGEVCDSSASYFNLECLGAALVVTSGDFETPDGKGLSHITFYDSVDPHVVVPVPGAVWLMLSGLVGLLGFSRRKK